MFRSAGSGPLRYRVFRRLFAAQVIALAGTGLLTVALGLLAYDIAGRAAGSVLGTALAIKMIAYVFVAPVMSAVTERLPSKAVLVGADAVRAAVAVLLPVVDQVWHVYVLVFVLQAASATFTPAFQSIIPVVLSDERDYTRGLSLSRLAYDVEALLSPVLAAALLTVLPYNAMFVGTAMGFVASALLVHNTVLPRRHADAHPPPLRARMLQGSRIMWVSTELRALLAMNVTVAAVTGLVVVNTVVYVRDILGGGDIAVALLLACYGAGSMAMALLVPRLLGRVVDRVLMLAGAAMGAVGLVVTAAALSAGAGSWSVLVPLWILLGAATSTVNTPAGRLLRRGSTDANRTAVFTAQFSLSHAGFLVTYPLAGWVGSTVDQAAAALILAIVATCAAAAATRIIVHGRSAEAHGQDTGLESLRPESSTQSRT